MFRHFTEDVSDENMGLLDTRCAGRWDSKGNISNLCKHPSIVSSEGHRFYSHLFRDFKGFDHVGGVPAGADTDRNIPFLTEGPELFRKDLIEGHVVGNAGQDRRIGREGDGREGRTVHDISIDEFRSEVLGVGGTSSVSKEKEFVSRFEGMRD